MNDHRAKERAVARGLYLTDRRMELGRSVPQIARLTGKNSTSIYHLEAGRIIDVPASYMDVIRVGYELSLAKVLSLCGVQVGDVPDDADTRHALAVGRMLLDLPDPHKTALIGYVNHLHAGLPPQ